MRNRGKRTLLDVLLSLPSRKLRADTLLIALVMLLCGMAVEYYGGDTSPLHLLLGKEKAEERAVVTEPAPVCTADVSHVASTGERGDAEQPPASSIVTFCMQNVRNYFVAGEQQRGRYVVHPKPEAECEAVADHLVGADPDVIGLIEIGGPMALADLRARLSKRGIEYPYYRVLPRNGEDRALALLSKLPIVSDDSKADYNLEGQKRRKLLRGLLDVTVKAPDGRCFRIIGVHLKSRVANDEQAATAQRNAEARTLAFYLQREMRLRPNVPTLVYGDWNDTPDTEAVRMVEEGVSEDAAMTRLSPKDSNGEEWTLYYGKGKQYYTFDHIFVNKVLRGRIQPRKGCRIIDGSTDDKATDHRALLLELR